MAEMSFSVDGKHWRGRVPPDATAAWVTVAALGIYDPRRLLVMPLKNTRCGVRFFEGGEIVPIEGGEEFETCPRGKF